MGIGRISISGKLLWILSCLFLAFTVIGTLSHELGHALVARYYGYRPHIGYAYTDYGNPQQARLDSMCQSYWKEIKSRQDFPDSAFFWSAERSMGARIRPITWGGPVQTMLTGTIGLLLLLIGWRRFKEVERLTSRMWFIVFITLFWLRQTTNFVLAMVIWAHTGRLSTRSDEVQLAIMYGIPKYSISAVTGVLGLIVFGIVYCAVPPRQRPTFMLAGVIGGSIGYVAWLLILGPIVMP